MKLKLSLCLFSFFGFCNVYSIDIIEFDGKERDLQQLIEEAFYNPNTTSFADTAILFLNKKGEFIDVGDFLSINSKYLKEIKEGNYVYVPNYVQRESRFNSYQKRMIAALIVGTSNKSFVKESLNPHTVIHQKVKGHVPCLPSI